jgi:ABC-type lipoprotein export system ATPase subunit
MMPMYINKNITAKERKEKSIEILRKFGLADRIFHYPKQLSGGEQQRVAIARALANNPNYILADEPTGNLDEDNELKIFETLKLLSKENKCIVVVTHNSIVKDYADEVFQIDNGILRREL